MKQTAINNKIRKYDWNAPLDLGLPLINVFRAGLLLGIDFHYSVVLVLLLK